jgi:hypothetical protein
VHGGLVLAAAGAAGFAMGRAGATSVLFGGALIWANLWLFKQLFGFLVRRQPTRQRLAIALLFAKLPVLWGLFWLVARARLIVIEGAGLAAGITCFPAAVVLVVLAWRPRPEI